MRFVPFIVVRPLYRLRLRRVYAVNAKGDATACHPHRDLWPTAEPSCFDFSRERFAGHPSLCTRRPVRHQPHVVTPRYTSHGATCAPNHQW
ncbi:unnamed protein product [Pieris macdunnoughi]|uniref:Uncharacterized protein n=1 Tax=Pieris macdunnoughi TaxID=345717 RepID=A0A821S948_9NEOP|nr:unnamed protein product [Pieris macdunnoughi]